MNDVSSRLQKTKMVESNGMHVGSLMEELQRLQQLTNIGYEVTVQWLPDIVRHHNGKQLLEEVVGDIIFIYTKNPTKAKKLVVHGFAEWMLNQHTKPYRQLINKLIALFEEQQYDNKEKIIEALTRSLSQIAICKRIARSQNGIQLGKVRSRAVEAD